MRSTTDTLTGRRFRWNTTVTYLGIGDEAEHTIVPARATADALHFLAPDRVVPALLARLNPEGSR